MQQPRRSSGPRVDNGRRYPLPWFRGPPHLARQIAITLRLAPAEEFRGDTAVLLSCGEPAHLRQAEEALRIRWPLDAVHPLRCPVRSWAEALADGGTVSWLRHYVIHEIQQREPTLLAILDHCRAEREGDVRAAHALGALLRGWGAICPVVVLRVRASAEVEWVVASGASFGDTR